MHNRNHIWVTKTNKKIKVKDLKDSHLMNIHQVIKNRKMFVSHEEESVITEEMEMRLKENNINRNDILKELVCSNLK